MFLAVAEKRSFRGAARDLGVTCGAVSQAIRALEARVGLPLLQRTTRSVALTEAGAALYDRLRPASTEIVDAIKALEAMGSQPSGTLRITVPRMAVPLLLEPVMGEFRKRYPLVLLDVSANDALIELGAGGFDAGIRLGEAVAKDMIGLPLTPAMKWAVVGAPAYFDEHGHPQTPRELLQHEGICCRKPTHGQRHRWEFLEKGRIVVLDVPAAIVVDDGEVALSLARQGLGLAYTAEMLIEEDVACGRLVTTLDAYTPTSPGFFLYFPAGTQSQPKLRALIDTLKAQSRLTKSARPSRGSKRG